MEFREDYNEYDLEGACVHAHLDVESVKFDQYIDDLNPLDLLISLGVDLSPLKKYPFGWANNKETSELLDVLEQMNSTTRGYWDELLQCPIYTPVILIDGNLCDGAHRCILAYLQGSKVRGAKFYEVDHD